MAGGRLSTAAGRPIPVAAPPSPNALAPAFPPDPTPDEPASPVDVGLRLVTDRLAVPAALLLAADPGGPLRVVAAVGMWGGDEHALQALAETLSGDGDVLDVTGAVEGARFAAGARLGDGEGALLVLDPDDRSPDEAWTRAFADAAHLALALVRSAGDGGAATRVLHEVAVHPGTFDERLAVALGRLAGAVGLDAAAFARTDGGGWTPEAVFDPSGRLVPTAPVPLGETFCAFTTQSDGPLAVEDGPGSPFPVSSPASYLGAPVFVGGRCVGTLSTVGHRARTRPFSDADRGLVEALAQWVGSAVGGRETSRRLAAREADLSAFFDAAPMGMGVLRPAAPDDLEVVAANAAAAAILGADVLLGRRASEGAVAPPSDWLAACLDALGDPRPQRFESEVGGRDGRRTLATTLSPIASHDEPRFAFVLEDVTEARRTADRVREREDQIEALLSQAPVALFATDRAGRLAMSRGRGLDALGLSVERALGQPVADVFAGAPGAAEGIGAALDGGDGAWTVAAGDRAFRVQAISRRDGAGRPAGLIGVALDTTGLASAPTASADARAALLKHLDHEIRSPLTSILGYADLLSEHTPPGEIAEVRDVIARSGERLLGALDEVLDLAVLDGADLAARPGPVDACAVVTAVAEASRTAAEAQRLALNLWCTLPTGPVLLDARLFERVARHLVGGAVAAATGTRVDVTLHVVGAELELSVFGGVPASGAVGPDLVRRLAAVMGGAAHQVPAGDGGWVVRLPFQPVPVVELSSDGGAGEAPAMDLGDRAG